VPPGTACSAGRAEWTGLHARGNAKGMNGNGLRESRAQRNGGALEKGITLVKHSTTAMVKAFLGVVAFALAVAVPGGVTSTHPTEAHPVVSAAGADSDDPVPS
jgi:hypothetical protein